MSSIKTVDFGESDLEYKRRYCNQVINEGDIYIYAPSTKGIALNMLKTFVDGIKRQGKMILNTIFQKDYLRNRWRDYIQKRANREG